MTWEIKKGNNKILRFASMDENAVVGVSCINRHLSQDLYCYCPPSNNRSYAKSKKILFHSEGMFLEHFVNCRTTQSKKSYKYVSENNTTMIYSFELLLFCVYTQFKSVFTLVIRIIDIQVEANQIREYSKCNSMDDVERTVVCVCVCVDAITVFECITVE